MTKVNYRLQYFKKTVSNYVGQSKNRHVIRPRNVDQNKKLLVTTEREDSATEMQIPKVANIEVPKIELVQGYKSSLKFFHPPDYYYTHPTLPNNTLENIQGYEINEDDLKMLESIATSKKLPPSLLNQKIFEDAFEL